MKNLLLLVVVFATVNLYAQEYFVINFEAESEEETIETVFIINDTRGTIVEVSGDEVVHLLLVDPVKTEEYEIGNNKLLIFPNPMENICYFEFNNLHNGLVNIELHNIAGKLIHKYSSFLPQAVHTFSLSGVSAGVYIISVETEENYFTGRFVSTQESKTDFSFVHNNERQITDADNYYLSSFKNYKYFKTNTKEDEPGATMEYNTNDSLRLRAFTADDKMSSIDDSPQEDKTYEFNFSLTDSIYPCETCFIIVREVVGYVEFLRCRNNIYEWRPMEVGDTLCMDSRVFTDLDSYCVLEFFIDGRSSVMKINELSSILIHSFFVTECAVTTRLRVRQGSKRVRVTEYSDRIAPFPLQIWLPNIGVGVTGTFFSVSTDTILDISEVLVFDGSLEVWHPDNPDVREELTADFDARTGYKVRVTGNSPIIPITFNFAVDKDLTTDFINQDTLYKNQSFFVGFSSNSFFLLTEDSFVFPTYFKQDNVFEVLLSDSNGNFNDYTVIGSLESEFPEQIEAIIPDIVSNGDNYRIRVKSTNPEIYGTVVGNINNDGLVIRE